MGQINTDFSVYKNCEVAIDLEDIEKPKVETKKINYKYEIKTYFNY